MPDIFHSFNTYMEEHNYPLCASDIVKKIVLSSDLFSRKFVDEHGGGSSLFYFLKCCFSFTFSNCLLFSSHISNLISK